MHAATEAQSANTIHIPVMILRNPKKTGDQSAFTAIWRPHSAKAYWLPSIDPARAPAKDMQTYSVVQATGNAQSGGVNPGFFSVSYHAPGGNIAPVIPAAMQAAKKITNSIQSIEIR